MNELQAADNTEKIRPFKYLHFFKDGTHCVFGEIVEGLDEILTAFNETICDEEHRPYQVKQDLSFLYLTINILQLVNVNYIFK